MMPKEQLTIYLQEVAMLEVAIQQQEQVMKEMDERACGLRIPARIVETEEKKAEKITPPSWLFIAEMGDETSEKMATGCAGVICVAIVMTLILMTVSGAGESIAVLWKIVLGVALIAFLVIEVPYLLYYIPRSISVNRKNAANNAAIQVLNQAEKDLYAKALEKDKQRLQDEENEYRALERAYNVMREQVDASRAALNKLYEENIIYPDFRGLVPVTYLYRYVAAGISDQLEGPTGAYAQYLNDERTNKICRRLDVLSQQLAQIIFLQKEQLSVLGAMDQTMWEIRNAINTTNQSIQQMNREVERLTQQQVTANEYLNTVSDQLSRVSSSIDIAAINTRVLALNDYHKSLMNGVNAYYLRYPA